MSSQALPAALCAALQRAENLPSLPAVAVAVLRLAASDDCTIDDLAKVLSSDPALSAKLLRLSNSSLFNPGQEVTTLQRATMVLGMKTVRLMSLSFSLAGSLPHSGAGSFDFKVFWRRSLVAAVAGRSLAHLVGSKKADEAFLCGLLSHFGQLVLSQCLAEPYSAVLKQAGRRWPTLGLEQKLLGYTSADVAEVLLDRWKLPETIRMPVAFMNRPNQLPADCSEEQRELALLMALTAQVVSLLCDEDPGPVGRRVYELMERRFSIGAPALDEWLIGLESGIRETADLLNVELPSDLDHRALVDQARMQIVNLSLDAAVDLRRAERRAEDLSTMNEKLHDRAMRDKLTGLHNRRAFDDALAREIESRACFGRQHCLGLVMIDVDKFKAFNDTYGHQAGDAVLGKVGEILTRLTRKGDLAARYGGEEFALILPATTPAHLRAVAERVRTAIEEQVLEYAGKKLRITASFGGACLQRSRGSGAGKALIQAADGCLYQAKAEGRNRSVVLESLLERGQAA